MDALRQKLLGLVSRLKGGFNEQDHPRADDGKFGSGGGGDGEHRATIEAARDDLFQTIGENDFKNSLVDRVEMSGSTWDELLVAHEEYDGIASVDREKVTDQLQDDWKAAKALAAEVTERADMALADLGERGLLTKEETTELQAVRDTLISRLENRQAQLGKDSTVVLKAVDRWEKVGDPGVYNETDPESVARHERWAKASTELIDAADRQQLSLSNVSDAANLDRLHSRADKLLMAHKGQAKSLAQKLHRLRDRFRRMLP